MNEHNNIKPQPHQRTKLNKLTKILILTLPILIILAGISASAGAAYAYKFGASRKTMLAVEAYVANDGSQAKAGASIFDWNHDDGIEKVYEYVRYYETYMTSKGEIVYVVSNKIRVPSVGYALGEANFDVKCKLTDGGSIRKIGIYMEGYREGSSSSEGKLSVSATPNGPIPTTKTPPQYLNIPNVHG